MNRSQERREAVSRETKARWESGEQREAVEGWHRDNREASLAGASNARSHITDTSMAKARAAMNKTSKMHLRFKDRMVNAGFTGFTTEGKVGPFEVDEVHAELRIAVEIDGCYWHGCSDCGHPGVPSTLANDKRKDAYLKAAGWTLLRIPGHMVRENPETALGLIAAAVEQAHRSAA
jgi:very-short-patch-repair endonuclease